MGIEASAVARVVGIDTIFKDLRGGASQFLPQHVGIVGQGATASAGYPLAPYRITSAQTAAARYGFGSPIHLAALQLIPATGGGVGSIPVTVFPLAPDAAGAAAVGSITPSGAATVVASYRVRIAGILSAPFTTAVGDTVGTIADKMVLAINAVLEMPVIAADGTTDVDLTAKWKGAAGNDLVVEVFDSTGAVPTSGLTFAVVQPADGAADPDVAPALSMLGGTWVTMIVNTLGPANTNALGKYADTGEGRWGELVNKPFVVFTGNTEAAVATATTTTNARATDRVNAQLVAPGSPNLPLQVAAAQVREIVKVANGNPPTDYGSRVVRGILPGPDGVQWDYAQRDQAVKAGSSTIEVEDGLVQISDVVTFYKPTGEVPPAYRFVVDIVKVAQVTYNFALEFRRPAWDGAPLIPDGQPTANPNARTPSAAKAAACAIIDALALDAILSDPATAKKNTFASINSQNPKRLDLRTTIQLSGNVGILSIEIQWGFFFGTPALAA